MTSNSQVAHIWFAQSKDHAKGSNFYFEDKVIYSYGPHFPIARHVSNATGKRAILFTTDSRGNATAKHLNYTRRAIASDMPVFRVPNVMCFTHGGTSNDGPIVDNYKSYDARIAETMRKLAKARTYKQLYMEDAVRLAEEGNAYAEFCGLPDRYFVPTFSPESMAQLAMEARERAAKDKARREERERARAVIEATARDEWRLGGNVRYFDNPVMLRLSRDGKTVETSRRAEVPAAHAARAFRFVKFCRETKTEWSSNGHTVRVGHFQIDHIDTQGNIRAGCHVIQWSEIERCARLLGIVDVAGGTEALESTHTAA
jgi:hypothetical protein